MSENSIDDPINDVGANPGSHTRDDPEGPVELIKRLTEQVRIQNEELSILRIRNDDVANSEEVLDLQDRLEEAETHIMMLEDKLDERDEEIEDMEEEVEEFMSPSSRRPPPHFKLPNERKSHTHAFRIGPKGGLGEGYLIVGFYPDSDDVGEIFIKMNKHSEEDLPQHLQSDDYVAGLHQKVSDLTTFLRGVLDQLAISVAVGLQRGIPLEVYARKYKGTRFPPDGPTSNPTIPIANSIVDYLFRYLGYKFIDSEEWKTPDHRSR